MRTDRSRRLLVRCLGATEAEACAEANTWKAEVVNDHSGRLEPGTELTVHTLSGATELLEVALGGLRFKVRECGDPDAEVRVLEYA